MMNSIEGIEKCPDLQTASIRSIESMPFSALRAREPRLACQSLACKIFVRGVEDGGAVFLFLSDMFLFDRQMIARQDFDLKKYRVPGGARWNVCGIRGSVKRLN